MPPLGGGLLAPRRERLEIKQLTLPHCTGWALQGGFSYPVRHVGDDAVETPWITACCGTAGARQGLAEPQDPAAAWG